MTATAGAGSAPSTPRYSAEAEWTVVLEDAPVALDVRPAGRSGSSLIAVGGAEGSLVVVDPDGRLIDRSDVPGGTLILGWSPDGGTLAVGGPGGAFRYSPGHPVAALPATGWCSALAWTPQGRLAVGDGRSAAVVEQAEQGYEPAWRTPDQLSTVTGLLWLRDGRELAVAAYGGIRSYTRGRPAPARELAYAGSLLATALSADGRWVVSGNQDASIHVWRLRDGTEFEMSGLPGKVTQVTFDVTGRWLAADSSAESTVWDFSGRGPAGTSPRVLTAHPDGATVQAWHPSQSWLATGGSDGVLAVWDVPRAVPGRPREPDWSVPVAPSARRGITALGWAADGSQLLIGTGDGHLIAYPSPALQVRAVVDG